MVTDYVSFGSSGPALLTQIASRLSAELPCSSACQADCAGFVALGITERILWRASARRPDGRMHRRASLGRRVNIAGRMPREHRGSVVSDAQSLCSPGSDTGELKRCGLAQFSPIGRERMRINCSCPSHTYDRIAPKVTHLRWPLPFPHSARISRFRVRISRLLGLNLPVRAKKFPFRFHRELRPKPLERELFWRLQLSRKRIKFKKSPVISLINGNLGVATGSYRTTSSLGGGWRCRRPRPIVLILWLLDSMQDASSAFNFATSTRWVRWEFHCLPRFHCAQRLPSGLPGRSSHAGATQSRANIYRDRRRTMQIVWRSAVASLRPMPCQS